MHNILLPRIRPSLVTHIVQNPFINYLYLKILLLILSCLPKSWRNMMKKEAPTITLSPIITVTQRVSSRQPNSKISKKRATNKKQKPPPPLHLSLPLHKYLCNFLKPILQQSDSSNKEFYSHSLPRFIYPWGPALANASARGSTR